MSKKNRQKNPDLQAPLGTDDEAPRRPAAIKPAPVKTVTPRRVQPQAAEDGLGFLDDAPALGLGLLCALLPRAVEPGIRDLFQLPKQLMMAEAAGWFLALLAVLAFLGRPLRLPRTPLVWPGLALLAAMLLSLAAAPDHSGGVLTLFAKMDAHRWLSAAVLFCVALIGLSSPRRLGYVLAGLLAGGVWVALIGIGEHHDIAALRPDRGWAVISKPGSTFGNRNMAAQLIVAVLPAAYAVLALGARLWGQGKKNLALGLAVPANIALLLLLYYLVLTVTRSAWVGAFLGLVTAAVAWAAGHFLASRRRRANETASQAEPGPTLPAKVPGLLGVSAKALLVPIAVVLLANAGIGAAAMVAKPRQVAIDAGDEKRRESPYELIASLFDFEQSAARWRFGMFWSTVEAIKAHPFGVGAGNWRIIYPQYVTQKHKNEMFSIAKQPIRAHNDFLQLASEFGVHGLLALLTLVGMAFVLTVRLVARAADPARDGDGSAWFAFGALGSLAAIIAICGDAMLSFPLQLPAPTFLFAVHLALIGAAEAWLRRDGEPAAVRVEPVPMPVKVGLAVAAGATLLFLGNLHERWLVAERAFTDARALQKRGQAQAGLARIEEAVAVNPDDFQNHFIKALCLNSLGRTKEAIAALHDSLRLYPNLLNAWVNVAMFNARLANDPRATPADRAQATQDMDKALQTALELKPDELVALNVKANWLGQRNRWDEVLKLLRPHFDPYQKYLTSDEFRGEDSQVKGHFRQMVGHLAKAAQREQQHAESVRYLQVLVAAPMPDYKGNEQRRASELIERLTPLARAQTLAGLHQEALPTYKQLAELGKRNRADLKRQYAVAAARVGDFQTAWREAQNAVALDRGEKARLLEELQPVGADRPEWRPDLEALRAQVGRLPGP